MVSQQHRRKNQRYLSPSINNKQQKQENNGNPLFNNLPIQEFSIQVHTGLGDNIDQYIALSPTLTRQIKQLKDKKWTIQWNTKPGSITDFGQDYRPGRILIDKKFDPGNNTDPNAFLLIRYVVSILAHEVAHAETPIQYDTSSKEACIRSALSGPGSEAAAVYNNIMIREEILINTKKREDMIKNYHDNLEQTNKFEQIIKDNRKQDALNKIGAIYRYNHPSNEPDKTYEQYYAKPCEQLVKKR